MSEEKKTHPEHKYSVTFVSKVGTITQINIEWLSIVINVYAVTCLVVSSPKYNALIILNWQTRQLFLSLYRYIKQLRVDFFFEIWEFNTSIPQNGKLKFKKKTCQMKKKTKPSRINWLFFFRKTEQRSINRTRPVFFYSFSSRKLCKKVNKI